MGPKIQWDCLHNSQQRHREQAMWKFTWRLRQRWRPPAKEYLKLSVVAGAGWDERTLSLLLPLRSYPINCDFAGTLVSGPTWVQNKFLLFEATKVRSLVMTRLRKLIQCPNLNIANLDHLYNSPRRFSKYILTVLLFSRTSFLIFKDKLRSSFLSTKSITN
jgi:hypothetical protein